jgi:pyruvate, water dikinase
MGLSNIKVMIPFVRTLKEAELVLQELEKNGLKRGVGVSAGNGGGSEKSGENKLETFGSGQGILGVGVSGAKTKAFNAGLEIIMMCEIPSNVILIEEFCKFFDGFSIGSNDLTQLTLGVDRDSEILSKLFDERDPAVKKMMTLAIDGAKKHHRHIGICGQAPSDLPEVAKFLIDSGIESISLNPDSLGQFLMQFKKL